MLDTLTHYSILSLKQLGRSFWHAERSQNHKALAPRARSLPILFTTESPAPRVKMRHTGRFYEFLNLSKSIKQRQATHSRPFDPKYILSSLILNNKKRKTQKIRGQHDGIAGYSPIWRWHPIWLPLGT